MTGSFKRYFATGKRNPTPPIDVWMLAATYRADAAFGLSTCDKRDIANTEQTAGSFDHLDAPKKENNQGAREGNGGQKSRGYHKTFTKCYLDRAAAPFALPLSAS